MRCPVFAGHDVLNYLIHSNHHFGLWNGVFGGLNVSTGEVAEAVAFEGR